MKKTVFCILISLAMIGASLVPITAEVTEETLIDNGNFEKGIAGYGVCYSGRTDTVMPSISAESQLVSEGSGALALFPGETLGEESSTGVMSKGFAYQGIYHKKTFVAEKGSGYVISADVYPKGAEVKARLLVMDGSRAIAASQAFEVDADGWEKIAFRWQPTQTVSKARIRVAFYQITEGKKIVIDALNCEEQILGNGVWMPKGDEVISLQENNVMSVDTVSNKASGIYCEIAREAFAAGTDYALVGTASTTADTAYLSMVNILDYGCHNDYVIKKEETVQVQLPFSVATIVEGKVRLEVNATTTGGKIILSDLVVVDANNIIEVSQSGQVLTVSGQLRKRNENKPISILATDAGMQTVTTTGEGTYTCDITIPAFEGARKKVTVTLSDINDYAEFNNQLSTDVYVTNNSYFDGKASAVAACTTAEEVKDVLTIAVLDGMGISAVPVVLAADKNAIFDHLAKTTITDGDSLADEILKASSWNALEQKKVKLCDIAEEYGNLLEVGTVDAYKDIYATADKTELNTMFKDSVAKISDKDSFAYALTELLVRSVMKSKTTYAQQMDLLEKYALDLDLDFSEYRALTTSAQKYSAATALTKDIAKVTDYSTLQAKLDTAVKAAKEIPDTGSNAPAGTGGFGSGGSVGIYNEEVKQENQAELQKPVEDTEYRFADLDGYSWAQDSIYCMVEKGVISQPADKQFRPGDSITRAEFVKMVAVLFEIDGGKSVSSFKDVKQGDWYHDYVMALYEREIVRGMNDSYFGSNEPISRQDICVIMSRIIEEIPDGTETFNDMEKVADYAKDAVRLMKKLGIINGYEDGSFRPSEFATRAEVAKILCGIE